MLFTVAAALLGDRRSPARRARAAP
jgi:hypothetical protein